LEDNQELCESAPATEAPLIQIPHWKIIKALFPFCPLVVEQIQIPHWKIIKITGSVNGELPHKNSNSSLEDNQVSILRQMKGGETIQIPHWKIIKSAPSLLLKGALVDSNSSLEDNQATSSVPSSLFRTDSNSSLEDNQVNQITKEEKE